MTTGCLPETAISFAATARDHTKRRASMIRSGPRTALLGVLALALAGTAPCLADDGIGGPGGSDKSWGEPLVISAADFRTNGNSRESFYFSSNGYMTGEGDVVALIAPVYLPGGASVRNITAHVYDNSSTCSTPDILVWLTRVGANTTTGAQTMATMATSGASSSMQTISQSPVSYPNIDNFTYTYYATVMLCSAAHELHSLVVYYEE
jgi:hypothetical protein